jgi:hypothetical protein
MEPKFKLYDVLKDKVTGFIGVCLGISSYATGCIHYGLMPQKVKKDGSIPDNYEWLDESRLILVKKFKTEKTKPHGGPVPNAPSI